MDCEQCGFTPEKGDFYCRMCGSEVPQPETVQCECGSEVREEDNYCHSCGVKFEEEVAECKCKQCGEEMEEDANFCPNCGSKVAGSNIAEATQPETPDEDEEAKELQQDSTEQPQINQGIDFGIPQADSQPQTDNERQEDVPKPVTPEQRFNFL